MPIDLHQLETFLAVAELKSFSKAAERMHRTQPAISQVIRKLEAETGEVLFERALRDGTLTAAGEVLRIYAERLLALRKEAGMALDELRSLDRGRLMLAANEYTCLYLLPVLDRFRRQLPHIGVTVQRAFASRIPAELQARSAEMGILSFAPDPVEFRTISVYRDVMAVVVKPGHPLTRRRKVSIRDLGTEDFIAHNVDSPLRHRVTQTFEENQTPLKLAVALPSMEAVKRFVAAGNGVAIVPGLTVARELETGELVRIEVPQLHIERELRLVLRRRASLSYVGEAFLKVAKAYAREFGSPYLYRPEDAQNEAAETGIQQTVVAAKSGRTELSR
jgi:DNA-binding transcriptional LysR family regulator